MKYGLLNHLHNQAGLINYGDHIQSLAAEQYLPQVDYYVERDRLNAPLEEECNVIMNGWFTYAPQNWPPNSKINPLFLSFHLNERFAGPLLSKPENVEYLKKHSPIGCRDYNTLKRLTEKGIECYYSFCLTTTLDIKYKSEIRNDDILFVDVLYPFDQRMVYKSDPKRILYHLITGRIFTTMNLFKKNRILRSLIPEEVIRKAKKSHQYCSAKLSTKEKFDVARRALKSYASAKCVVTSRIHCALPCLALGTPVLFVYSGLDDDAIHLSRLNGTIDHLNILTTYSKEEINKKFGKVMNVIHPDEIDWNNVPANPTTFKSYSEKLKAKCYEFIASTK